jgi:hypothetical protein
MRAANSFASAVGVWGGMLSKLLLLICTLLLERVVSSSAIATTSSTTGNSENGAAGDAEQALPDERLLDLYKNISSKYYIVILNDPPVATYQGGISGYAATAPGRTVDVISSDRQKLSSSSSAASQEAQRRYSLYLQQQSDAVAVKALGTTNSIRSYYSTVLAGFSVGPLSRQDAFALQRHKDVKGVYQNELGQLSTVSTPSFLGLDTPGGLWSQVGGASAAGENIIIGMVDAGWYIYNNNNYIYMRAVPMNQWIY